MAIVVALVLTTGGGTSSRRPTVAAPAAPEPAAPLKGLAIGLTEANANLLWSSAAKPALPARFGAGRDLLSALHPAYVRLVIDWAKLQPARGDPVSLDGAVDGCQREEPPCAAYAGVRDELRALRSQQQAQGGFAPVMVIDGTPDWAALPPSGCERPATGPVSRPIRPDALPAYRALIASLLALGRREGVALPWWSPWNEPNHPFFVSPQRDSCDVSSPSRAPAVYTELERSMEAALRRDGAQHHLLLGELAGFTAAQPRATSISEFVDGLPEDVLCASSIWTVHAYARRGAQAAAGGPVTELEDALDRRGACARRARIWVTETGAGAAHAGAARPAGAEAAPDARAGCRALATSLQRWYRDPRVDAVFQYSFREDNLFPVGLVDARLAHVYPSYWLLRSWAGTRAPTAPPPTQLPAQCAAT